MPKSKSKSVSVVLENPQPKKSVTRYDIADGEEGAMSSAYIDKDALKELGDPDEVRITIEAA